MEANWQRIYSFKYSIIQVFLNAYYDSGSHNKEKIYYKIEKILL